MNNKPLISLCCAVVLAQVSACSSVKELFPDKEKDYQFTTEIPKLIVPADLANGTHLSPATASTATVHPQSQSVETKAEPTETENAPVATETKPATTEKTAPAENAPVETETKPATTEKTAPAEEAASTTESVDDDKPLVEDKSITVDMLQSSTNVSYLRIGAPFLRTWRIVSKGLSRKSIEVSDRNQDEKIFTVQYDPDEKPVEDGSYLNEIDFMLHGFQGNEKEYKLKLVENNQQTDVVILNGEQKPASDDASLKLLKVLEKSIKANLAGK